MDTREGTEASADRMDGAALHVMSTSEREAADAARDALIRILAESSATD
jgi:hypothetical protein